MTQDGEGVIESLIGTVLIAEHPVCVQFRLTLFEYGPRVE